MLGRLMHTFSLHVSYIKIAAASAGPPAPAEGAAGSSAKRENPAAPGRLAAQQARMGSHLQGASRT